MPSKPKPVKKPSLPPSTSPGKRSQTTEELLEELKKRRAIRDQSVNRRS